MPLRQVRTVQTVQLVYSTGAVLGIVDMPVVVLDKCMIQTVQKTVGWDGCARRCTTTSALFGPDSAETVEIPQLSTE